jgi:hypothetical protein
MPKYYVETGLGCKLVEDRTIEAARRATLREVGSYLGVQLIRKATQEDINWVRTMQGARPKAA